MATAGHGRQVKQEKLLAALRAGNTRRAAAHYAGVDEKTFYNWLNGSSLFFQQVRTAEAAAEVTCATSIIKAAAKDWRAALAWLEHRRYAEWKERKEINLRDCTTEQLLELVKRGEAGADSAGDTAAVEGRLGEPLPLSE